jgi:hypothetical protein
MMAERLGIRFCRAGGRRPYVSYSSDGDDEAFPPPPGWRELVDEQSARLGWEELYSRAT